MKGFNKYSIREDGIITNLSTNKSVCQWVDNVGYLQVKLYENKKNYYKRVHRIVAEHFIPNPNNLPQVNHVNGDKRDNVASNLEWIDNKSNTQHGYDIGLYHSDKRSIKIEVYDLNNEYINTYKSIRETANILKINRKTLSRILFDDKENNYNYKFKAIDLKTA